MRALRIQPGRVLEMAESSADRAASYEHKIVECVGGRQELDLVIVPQDA